MIIVMSVSCSCHAQSQYLRPDSQHVYTDPGISDDELSVDSPPPLKAALSPGGFCLTAIIYTAEREMIIFSY